MFVNKDYCINSFLQFRFIHDSNVVFKKGLIPNYVTPKKEYVVNSVKELDLYIKDYIEKNVDEKTALMLSSGIDSAILASYLPKGTKAFTLNCIANGQTIDEVTRAKEIAEMNGLDHEVIDVSWDDYENYSNVLLEHKKAPFHSIEVQIYKAAKYAKKLGYNKLLFGESADSVFGGLDGLLSKDWKFDEFVKRFSFTPLEKVLVKPNYILEPFETCRISKNNIDAHKFISSVFFVESVNSYYNACDTCGVEFLSPYAVMTMGIPLDLEKVRNGNSKYLVRELFKEKYPKLEMNKKTPMPRPMELWLKEWKGPNRKEFKIDNFNELTGDQKWLVYILEKFLNYFEIE